jgi:flagellar biosynthesis protein FlhF
MRVKRYVADSIHEAILQVKSDLGRDALILHTKTFKVGGLFGLFAKKRIEVIAALDESAGKTQTDSSIEKSVALSRPPEQKSDKNQELKSIQEEMVQLREAIKEVAACLSQHPPVSTQSQTQAGQKDIQNSGQIITEVKEEQSVTLNSPMPLPKIGGPINLSKSPTVAALIGPTGVGKTTTIAKLAAHFVLFERVKVALITVDTYRIAAVEQLKTYAEIINLPVSVVYTPDDYKAAIEEYSDYDLILVDTAGRSQKNHAQIQELQEFLCQRLPDEIHLVISATTKLGDMIEVADCFSGVGFNRIIFSKLDETNDFGTIFALTNRLGIPLSYLTTGQNVPDDIEVVTDERLNRLADKEFSHA